MAYTPNRFAKPPLYIEIPITARSLQLEYPARIRRAALCTATLMMLVLGDPALPVLLVGVLAQGIEVVLSRRSNVAATLKVDNVPLLSALIGLALGVAVVARL